MCRVVPNLRIMFLGKRKNLSKCEKIRKVIQRVDFLIHHLMSIWNIGMRKGGEEAPREEGLRVKIGTVHRHRIFIRKEAESESTPSTVQQAQEGRLIEEDHHSDT